VDAEAVETKKEFEMKAKKEIKIEDDIDDEELNKPLYDSRQRREQHAASRHCPYLGTIDR
jgi:hypothetical protein